MRITWCTGLTLIWLLASAGSAAADEPLPPPPCGRAALPANVEIAADLAELLGEIIDRSPTFRAQCERIAEAERLYVTIRVDSTIPRHCRAFTIIRRRGWEIHAEVHLPPGRNLVELAAHEFEHVIEQIEGLNLRRLARMRGTGVYQPAPHLFETERAQKAGRRVLKESLDWKIGKLAD